VPEVDPTGAGDVFAAAFLIRLHETGNNFEAARFASAAAALSLGGSGISAIAGRAQIEAFLSKQRVRA
jgi:sugar/nucleoside kinase (ribokinase family)